MHRLRAPIQNYDWGDPHFIPSLQGRVPSGLPEAEMWMGAHPAAPSVLEGGASLLEVIEADPVAALGPVAADTNGALPYLAKILAAARPLSIQAHPSAGQAEAGYAREVAAGIPADAPERIYRDPNHKPELICALTTFEARCGFRDVASTRELVSRLGPGAAPLADRLAQAGPAAEVLADVLAWLLRLDPGAAGDLVEAVVAAAGAIGDGPFIDSLRWCATMNQLHPGDVGVVVSLLLNHVVLEPGDALYLGSGNLHGYLRGAAVEVMANSDNVARCALTTKHIDVEELLVIADTTPSVPSIQRATGAHHRFHVPAGEFDLERIVLRGEVRLDVSGPEILVATEGGFTVESLRAPAVTIGSGEAVWVPASDECCVLNGRATVFRVTVGSI